MSEREEVKPFTAEEITQLKQRVEHSRYVCTKCGWCGERDSDHVMTGCDYLAIDVNATDRALIATVEQLTTERDEARAELHEADDPMAIALVADALNKEQEENHRLRAEMARLREKCVWRCYHCVAAFTKNDIITARLHFGLRSDVMPQCVREALLRAGVQFVEGANEQGERAYVFEIIGVTE